MKKPKELDNRYGVDGKVLKVIRESINNRPLPKNSKLTAERRAYLLDTPRDELTPNDKRLQAILVKYGDVSTALADRDRTNMVLGGYIGGKRTGKKGFATYSKEERIELARKAAQARWSKVQKGEQSK